VLLLVPLWVVLSAILIGWGLLVLWILRAASIRGALTAFQTLWLGYSGLLGFLLLWAFVLPIDRGALVVGALPAIAGFWLERTVVKRRLRALRAAPSRAIVLGVLAVIVALVIGYIACDRVTGYDTNLYHSQVVQWNARYSAVPGLANLHMRFGYDNSVHLFAAFVDAFWQGEAVHAMNGFLMAAILVQWFIEIFTARTPRGRLRQTFCLLTLPFLLGKVWFTEIPSLSSDLPLALFSLVLVLELISLPRVTRERRLLPVLLILQLGVVATTTKLGGLGLLAAAGIASLVVLRHDVSRRARLIVLGVPAALMIAWLVRNAIISGWLLFPVFGRLPVSWAVPLEQGHQHLRWIESWARGPKQMPEVVLDHGFMHWFAPWFEGFRQSKEMVLLAVSGALLVWRFATGPSQSAARRVGEWAAIGACLLGMLQWFYGAPDLRFGGFLFWTLPAVLFAPMVANAMRDTTVRSLVIALSLAICAWNGGLTPRLDEIIPKLINRPIAPQRRDLVGRWTSPTTFVSSPSTGDQCGDEPIPCTPDPATQQLRDPNNLGAGYVFGSN
jgi:hypothetical protein